MMLLRISTLAVALALTAPAHAGGTDDGAAAQKHANRPSARREARPSKEAKKKPSGKKQAPAAKSASGDQKPAAKPCEEVKPCAIE